MLARTYWERTSKIAMLLILFVFVIPFSKVSASAIDTLQVFSPSMNKNIKVVVILPDSYFNGNRSFPVLYLLHGAGGSHQDWITKVPELAKAADEQQMIIICPDGSDTSWYFDSPIDPTMRYETFMTTELVSYIDKQLRTIKDRKGRAITGLSMGGHGAFYLAFRNQEIWGAAGSMSGGLDIRPFPKGWNLDKRLGDQKDHKENWETNTVINLIPLIANNELRLIADCGTEDFFYQVNQDFVSSIRKAGVHLDYTSRPGAHDWNYWKNSIKYHLLFFHTFFNDNQ